MSMITSKGFPTRRTARFLTVGTAVLVAATTLAACASSSSSGGSAATSGTSSSAPKTLSTVKFQFDWTHTAGDIPVLAAEKFGWFADEGIKLKITPGGPTGNAPQQTAAGNQDISIGPATGILQVRATGAPLVAVGLIQPYSPTGEICNPNKGLDPANPKTLEGHTVGKSNSTYDAVLDQFLKANGVDESKIKFVTVGYSPSLLFSGAVDCFPDFLTLVPLQAAAYYKKAPVIFKTSSAGSTGQVIETNQAFLSAHPDLVKGFNTAYAKGMQWALKNTAAAVDLIKADYTDYDKAQAAQELPALEKFWVSALQTKDGLLSMDDSSWKPTYEALVGTKWLSKPVDYTKAYSTATLPSPAVMP